MSRKPNDRRDALKALFGGEAAPPPAAPTPSQPSGPPPAPAGTAPPQVTSDAPPASPTARLPAARSGTRSGAVKAMGLQLGALGDKLDTLGGLAGQDGERIVELDPALIDSAFIDDRLSRGGQGDESFEDLVASIRDGGQQVPVLVRPSPDQAGRYQAAYGHRRIAACQAAGVPVRAIVRPLTDGELVLAQGRENAMRRDLSFIEKARFAAQLVEAGFSRGDVQRALVLHAADMTRMLAVADAVPSWIAHAVGPAPKAGRARWDKLAQTLATPSAQTRARKVIGSEMFKSESSDGRFARLFAALTQPEGPTHGPRQVLKDAQGRRVATLSGTKIRPVLTLDAKAAPRLLDALKCVIEDHLSDGTSDQPETGDGDR